MLRLALRGSALRFKSVGVENKLTSSWGHAENQFSYHEKIN